MKVKKLGTAAILATALLITTGCQDTQKNSEVTNNVTGNVSSVKKHESVDLPITIYTKENYNMLENATFTRTIDSIEVGDFTKATVVEFENIYDDIRDLSLDLINEYKRVSIQMTHTIDGKTSQPYQAFVLDKNSEIHFNAEPIQDEIVKYQIKMASTDYVMGANTNKKGEIILAIPKAYFDGNLQLKTVTKTNNDINEVVYIDLR